MNNNNKIVVLKDKLKIKLTNKRKIENIPFHQPCHTTANDPSPTLSPIKQTMKKKNIIF